MVGRHLRDDLRGNVTGRGKAVRPFNQRACDHRAVLQHILQIHQIAVVHVLGKIVRIVKMNDALVMRVHNVLRQQNPVCNVSGHLARHIIALGGVYHRVFVGVFLLGLFIVAFNQAQNPVVRRVGLAHQRPRIAIGNIRLGHFKRPMCHDLVFHHILHFFYAGRAAQLLAGQHHALRNAFDLQLGHAGFFAHGLIGLSDRHDDFLNIKIGLGAVAFYNFHACTFPPFLYHFYIFLYRFLAHYSESFSFCILFSNILTIL